VSSAGDLVHGSGDGAANAAAITATPQVFRKLRRDQSPFCRRSFIQLAIAITSERQDLSASFIVWRLSR
jgi:hypothetical protein